MEDKIKISCQMCDTHVYLELSEHRIISTDQGAGFIRVPEYVCEKCGSACLVELPEPKG